jgi:3-hydroxyisobutyrate dehydrogenase
MSDLPTVAVLGTGTMGAPMARRLAEAGAPVRVWNRSREKAEPLAGAGATVASSPAEAVRGADVVLTMLFDADSVAETMDAARDGLAAGSVWLQQSTVGVAGADRLAALAEELGLVYVDAPVLGTRQPAEDGSLVVLASGPEAIRSVVTPLFEVIGSRTMWVGPAGAASRLKLAANSWVLTVVDGIAEALTLTRALGLDPQLFLEAVKGGAMDAPYVQLKGAGMLAGEFPAAFGLAGAAKDADLIVAAARDAGVDLAVVEAARAHIVRALDAGHGDRDVSATFLEH